MCFSMPLITGTLNHYMLLKQDTDLLNSAPERWGKKTTPQPMNTKEPPWPTLEGSTGTQQQWGFSKNPFGIEFMQGVLLAAQNRICSFSFHLSKMFLIFRRSMRDILLLMDHLSILHISFKFLGFQSEHNYVAVVVIRRGQLTKSWSPCFYRN